MDQPIALAQLTANVAATTAPVLDATALSRLLALAAVPDSAGRAVSDPAWVPTYSASGVQDASAQGWMEKAGKLTGDFDVGVGSGVTFSRSQKYLFCLRMAASYGSAAAAAALGVAGGGKRRGVSVAVIGSSAP